MSRKRKRNPAPPPEPDHPLLRIPRALCELRQQAGLSEDRLGHKLGVQGSSVHKIETGNPRLTSIARHAQALGVDHHALCAAIDRILGEGQPELPPVEPGAAILISALQREVAYWMERSKEGRAELTRQGGRNDEDPA